MANVTCQCGGYPLAVSVLTEYCSRYVHFLSACTEVYTICFTIKYTRTCPEALKLVIVVKMFRYTSVLILAVVLSAASHAYLVSQAVAQDAVLDCGSTPDEARALGCHFDLFSYAWYAPPCYNKDLHQSFLTQHRDEIEWRHMDYSPLTTDDVLTGNHWSLRPISGQFHDLHCTYAWLRLIRALAEERPMDWKLLKFEHSQHCSKRLLEKDKSYRNETATQNAQLSIGRCGLTPGLMYAYGATG